MRTAVVQHPSGDNLKAVGCMDGVESEPDLSRRGKFGKRRQIDGNGRQVGGDAIESRGIV